MNDQRSDYYYYYYYYYYYCYCYYYYYQHEVLKMPEWCSCNLQNSMAGGGRGERGRNCTYNRLG